MTVYMLINKYICVSALGVILSMNAIPSAVTQVIGVNRSDEVYTKGYVSITMHRFYRLYFAFYVCEYDYPMDGRF